MASATAKRPAKKTTKTTARKSSKTWGGIGSEAVKKATGCDWDTWFKALDYSGCRDMSHKEIAAFIHKRWPKVGGWWSQMVTVGYEQARGLRQKNQSMGSWRVSSSKTVAVPVKSLFQAWLDPKTRRGWLKDHGITIRKSTAPKSMRITWVDGKTTLEANFTPKGARKSAVALEHGKLAGKKQVEKMRSYWTKALDKLKAELEA
jgi:uncharacterized protein YndB with AHSA1/START domain